MNDLTGKRFGYLTVKELNNRNKKGASWLCKCGCGNDVILSTALLVGTNNTRPRKSCGCKQYAYNGMARRHLRVYHAWYSMIDRCHNPNSSIYWKYGARGVSVCEEWRDSFKAFLDWALNNGYEEHLTLDRIDNSKPYSPANCRWVDYYIQEQNRGKQRRNKLGFIGIDKRPYSYRASIQRYGIRKHIGCFKTLEEAIEAREKAEKKFKETGTL